MKLNRSAHGVSRETGGASEDAFRVEERGESVFAVLADGLGSSQEGGLAARRAVEMFCDYYLSRPQAWSPRRALREFAHQINRLFFQESQQRHGSPELLCTLSVIALEGDRLYGLNLGDSPVFLFRRGQLTRLSESHSLAEDGLHHVVTRALGLTAELEPHCFESTLEAGDVFLLCSDGVSPVLADEKIADLLARRTSAQGFINAASAVAAKNPELLDDASAIVLDLVTPGWPSGNGRHPLEVIPKLENGNQIDGYTLLRSLQEGDRVWLATSPDGSSHVLKFPPKEASDDETRRDAFVREMWNATRIQSPDFVRAFMPAASGALRFYAMEYVEAPTLRAALAVAPLTVEETLTLARTLLRAGQFLLTRDLAHGDLKPDNILVVRDPAGASPPRFVLLDLGSAAEIFSVTTRAGTPSYLAPERFRGAPLSERTELYAIGVILYEALTRTYPYGEIERFQTPRFEQTPRRPTRLNSAIPPWLESAILRTLEPDESRRYQNFSELLYALDHPAEVAAYHRKGVPLLERDPLLLYKLLCLLLLLLNILQFALRSRSTSQPAPEPARAAPVSNAGE